LFNQPYNVISYTTDDLNTRTAKADLLLNKFLVERVEEETNGIEIKGSKLCMDVEDIIKDALPSGIPALLEVAEQIGMSARTLTRRLAENDVTFRDLIKKSQEDISKNLLTTTKRNIAEIAFETGFSEQSAFNRAFKRWTGLSPLEYRKQE
jgi:AraC-like DNA-binding protein